MGHLDVARWLVTNAGSDARSERNNVSCRCSCNCLCVFLVVPRTAMLLFGVWCCDQFGGSALLAACLDGHLDVARWLVTDAGSDVRSERDNVSCPMLCSCTSAAGLYRRECMRLLGCGAASPRQVLRSCLCCCDRRTARQRSHSPATKDTGALRAG